MIKSRKKNKVNKELVNFLSGLICVLGIFACVTPMADSFPGQNAICSFLLLGITFGAISLLQGWL